MERQRGNDPVFEPIEIAVCPQLEAVRMVKRAVSEPVGELLDIETSFDLLDLRGSCLKIPSIRPSIWNRYPSLSNERLIKTSGS
jgi:hypothetical protein